MRNRLFACSLAFALFFTGPFYAASATENLPKAEIKISAENLKEALEDLASLTVEILEKEKMHIAFDRLRFMKEVGLAWRPELMAPSDLAPKLPESALYQYAGVKLADAIYAAVFGKKKEVADSIKVVEEVMQLTDIRSHADFDGRMIKTVKKAALEPEGVDAKTVLEELTNDFISQLPVFSSSQESVNYLFQGFCGFTVQSFYITTNFFAQASPDQLAVLDKKKADLVTWINMLESLFDASCCYEEICMESSVAMFPKLGLFKRVKNNIAPVNRKNESYTTSHQEKAQRHLMEITNIRNSILETASTAK